MTEFSSEPIHECDGQPVTQAPHRDAIHEMGLRVGRHLTFAHNFLGFSLVFHKIGKNIGNARYPINLVNALIITHAANYKKKGGELKRISEEDIRTYEETKRDKERSLDEILADLNIRGTATE